MPQELIYTSAEKGLKLGSRGFCTVASSAGMAKPLADRLEALSGYRHLFPPESANARLNPINFSCLTFRLSGKNYHVLSRIADAGLDHTQRSNKIAHHVALDRSELTPAGPAWLASQPGYFTSQWDQKPRLLSEQKQVPADSLSASVCHAWREVAGDAGWAGVLAESLDEGTDALIIFKPETNVLQLVLESQALLSPARRWDATFSTFFTKLPPGVDCRWRFIPDSTPEAELARRSHGSLIIDLAKTLPDPEESKWVLAARNGTEVAEKVELPIQEEFDAPPVNLVEPSTAPPGQTSDWSPDLALAPPALPPGKYVAAASSDSIDTHTAKSRSTLIVGIGLIVILFLGSAGFLGYRYMSHKDNEDREVASTPPHATSSAEGKPPEGKPADGQPPEGKPPEGKPAEGKPAEGKPAEGKPADGQPPEGQPPEGQPPEGQPPEGQPPEGKPAEGKPAEGKPPEGQPPEGQPPEGKPADGQPPDGQPPEGQPPEGQPPKQERTDWLWTGIKYVDIDRVVTTRDWKSNVILARIPFTPRISLIGTPPATKSRLMNLNWELKAGTNGGWTIEVGGKLIATVSLQSTGSRSLVFEWDETATDNNKKHLGAAAILVSSDAEPPEEAVISLKPVADIRKPLLLDKKSIPISISIPVPYYQGVSAEVELRVPPIIRSGKTSIETLTIASAQPASGSSSEEVSLDIDKRQLLHCKLKLSRDEGGGVSLLVRFYSSKFGFENRWRSAKPKKFISDVLIKRKQLLLRKMDALTSTRGRRAMIDYLNNIDKVKVSSETFPADIGVLDVSVLDECVTHLRGPVISGPDNYDYRRGESHKALLAHENAFGKLPYLRKLEQHLDQISLLVTFSRTIDEGTLTIPFCKLLLTTK